MLPSNDYTRVAHILRDTWKHPVIPEVEDFRGRLSLVLAEYFKEDNPRFDKQQFLTNCGL